MVANIERNQLTDYDKAMALKAALAEGYYPNAEAIRLEYGVSKSTFYNFMSFCDLPESIKEIIEENPRKGLNNLPRKQKCNFSRGLRLQ
ncbi:hypothetical protein [Chromobacterium sp. ATCC 53434]|uniref:hypothetical protein n=1 Tax=Chromobacterium sp. (strain ATCC 53434 / SC 14030) TaxID=2059672 RepID=UPI00130514D2|nr:hypothetical protein [Chromobacterium sp. ATCC 53434]